MAHVDSYKRMKYLSDDGTEEEWLWNSREGVTPFIITLRSGKSARHVEWNKDEYLPDYVPPKGSRIFIDMTEARARQLVEQTIHRYEMDGTFEQYGRSPTLEEDLMASYFKPGAPDIMEVE